MTTQDQIVLLVLPSTKEVYPLSTSALTRAQSSRAKLASDYRDALILERSGTLRRIERVEVQGPWGESVGRRIVSRLTEAWDISVELSEPLSWDFDRVKRLVAECIEERGDLAFPEMKDGFDRRHAAGTILAARDVAQVFDALPMPDPEDALDVL